MSRIRGRWTYGVVDVEVGVGRVRGVLLAGVVVVRRDETLHDHERHHDADWATLGVTLSDLAAGMWPLPTTATILSGCGARPGPAAAAGSTYSHNYAIGTCPGCRAAPRTDISRFAFLARRTLSSSSTIHSSACGFLVFWKRFHNFNDSLETSPWSFKQPNALQKPNRNAHRKSKRIGCPENGNSKCPRAFLRFWQRVENTYITDANYYGKLFQLCLKN